MITIMIFIKLLVSSNPDIRYNNGGTMKKVDKGGITYGNSHDDGGIPVKNASTGQMLEVEGGEGIVNKRSMASDKKVKMNGREMTICEAVSHLNQMEGGVRFSCDDVEHRQFIEQMELGGELERGKRTEREHIDTLIKLYEKKLTPNQATIEVAKEHLKEDPKYYSKLAKMEGKMGNGGKAIDEFDIEYDVKYDKLVEGEYEPETKTFSNLNDAISFATKKYSSVFYRKYKGGKEVESGYVEISERQPKMNDGGYIGKWTTNEKVHSNNKLTLSDLKKITPDKFYKYEYFSKTDKVWKDIQKTDYPYDLVQNGYEIQLKEPYRYSMGDGGMADNQQAHFSKMTKEEKRARIAELKKNFVEKAKQGTKVKDGDAPVYPKMNKYTGFFDTMSKYQDEYKKAVSAHEKTVTEGLRVKDDKKIPKKEKEARLETLRQELIQDKTRLKEARQDLAKLPEMESPFYAPKLAEGGQIVGGMTTFDRAQKGDVGSLVVKPIKDDVSLYNLPKTGFTIDWSVNNDGTYNFVSYIGKRSVGVEAVVRLMKDNYNRTVVGTNFLRIDTLKSNYGFTFVSAPQTPIYAVTKFINFLRFLGNQKAFLENYDPNTLSVYTKGGGQQEQEEITEPLAIIANAVSDDLKNISQANQKDIFGILRQFSNLSEGNQDELASALVKWKKSHPDFDANYKSIWELMHCAKEYLALENSRTGVYLAFVDSNSTFAKYVNETLRENLFKTGDKLRAKFIKEYKIFSETRFARLWFGNSFTKSLLDAEGATTQAIYFLYLLKK